MGDFGDINSPEGKLQLRLAAHLRRVYVKNRYRNQKDMEAKTGINQGQISAIMNGSRTLGLETLLKLWEASGESIDYLLRFDPDDPQWFVRGLPLSAWEREGVRPPRRAQIPAASTRPPRAPDPDSNAPPIASPPPSASSSPRPTRRTKRGGAA